MLLLLSLITLSLAPSVHGAQITLQFTRATQSNAWKLPPFVKGGRAVQPPSRTVSSVLLQVRGGSDNRGDPSGYYYDDDYRKDKTPRRRDEYEEKRADDYYYGEQDRTYYEEDGRYEEYDDRGRGGVS